MPLLNQGGGFAERGGNPLPSPLAKEMLPETLTASHPSARGESPWPSWGLGKPTEQSAQSHGIIDVLAQLSCLSLLHTEPAFVLKSCTWPQIEIHIYFGDWIPAFLFAEYYCHFLRHGKTQQPFLGTCCAANLISRLQSSNPKAREQECGHHINIPGVSKFSSAFAVSGIGSFPVA